MNQPVHRSHPLAALREPEAVLRAAHDRFERLAVVSSLGPQTIVVLDLLHRLGLELPVVQIDTGLLFAETHALRRVIARRLDLEIRVVRPERTVIEQGDDEGDALWVRNPDRCCHLRKVVPLHGVLDGLDGWITGLRRDQGPTRAGVETVMWDARYQRWKVNPLAHWSRGRVFAYLAERELPYNPLLDQGFTSVGCTPCTRALTLGDDPDDERAGRWAGSTKTECGLHHDSEALP